MKTILLSFGLFLCSVSFALSEQQVKWNEKTLIAEAIATLKNIPKDNVELKFIFPNERLESIKESGRFSYSVFPPGGDPTQFDEYGQPKVEDVSIFSEDVVEASFTTPFNSNRSKCCLPTMDGSADGLVIYQGNLFAGGYYFLKTGGFDNQNSNSMKPMSELNSQPWFELDNRNGKFIYRTAGAQEKIIASIGKNAKTVDLYRGTTQRDADDINIFSLLKKTKRTPTEQSHLVDVLRARSGNAEYPDKLKSMFHEAAEQLNPNEAFIESLALELARFQVKDNRFVFLTPDKNAAEFWAKTHLITLKFDKAALLKLSKQEKVYAGIEYFYIEVALSSPEAIAYFLLNGNVQKK